MGKWILILIGAPYSMTVGYTFVLLAIVLRLARYPVFLPGGILTAVWKPWVAEKWPFSTTLGRGMVFYPGAREHEVGRTVAHEIKHVWQIDDLMLLSLLLGLAVFASTGSWKTGLCLYVSGGLWQLPNFIAAALRTGKWDWESMYRNSEHERSAYAQTDIRKSPMGPIESWEDSQHR